jgi:hypothetical protein
MGLNLQGSQGRGIPGQQGRDCAGTTWGYMKTSSGQMVPWTTQLITDRERKEWCRQSNELMSGWAMNEQRNMCGLDNKTNGKQVITKEPMATGQPSQHNT